MSIEGEGPKVRWFEWLLAVLAAANCAAVAIPTLIDSATGWPFPGLYMLEILLAGLINLYPVAMDFPAESKWGALAWASAGIVLAFVISGAWTINFLLLPAMIFLLLLGVLSDRRKRGNLALHFLVFITAAFLQALLFFLFVSF